MHLQIVRVTERSGDCVLNWAIIPGSMYVHSAREWIVHDVETGASYYLSEPPDGKVLLSSRNVTINHLTYELVLAGNNIGLYHGSRAVASVKAPVHIVGHCSLRFNVDHRGHIHIVFSTCIVELVIHN